MRNFSMPHLTKKERTNEVGTLFFAFEAQLLRSTLRDKSRNVF